MKENLKSLSETCLDAINRHLESLGSTTRWKKTPTDLPEYQSLHGKKVLLVDDQSTVIEEFVPHLTVATENNFAFILCNADDALEPLAQKIAQEKADLILLDYHISSTFKGTDVARSLVKVDHKGMVIGFSSDKGTEQKWRLAKVYAIVEKKAHEPTESIKLLASINSELDESDKTKRNYTLKQSGYISPSEMEIIGDHDSGASAFQHAPKLTDRKWVERIDSLLPRAECLNNMIVYKIPEQSKDIVQNERILTIDMQRTIKARKDYIEKQRLPIKSNYYPKDYDITYDKNGLPIFGKIKSDII